MSEFTVRKKRWLDEDNNGHMFTWYTARVLAWFTGVAGVLTGVMICLSIIFIPWGLLVINGSRSLFDFANGKRPVACPNCTKLNYVHVEQQRFTCRKCSEKVTVEYDEKKPAVN